MKAFAVLLLGFLVIAAGPPRAMRSIITLDGSCKQFVVAGTDGSDNCAGKVVNTEYTDGRVSFTFTTENGALVVTFSGNGRAQVHQGPDVAIQPLDTIIIGLHGKINSTRVVGDCQFSNPYKGPAPIMCQAKAESGEYSGVFLSDGGEPHILSFR